jgi:multiple sugar transport system permease protein
VAVRSPPSLGPTGSNAAQRWRAWRGYVFVLPLLLVMAVVVVYPVLYNARVSVFDYHPVRDTWTFVGLDNFATVVRSPVFWQSLRTTLLWVAANVGLQFVVGMAVAVALHRIRIGRGFLGGLFLVPWISSFVIVSILWMWVYHPQLGVLNDVLLKLGLIAHPVAWLATPQLAFVSLVVANSWKFFPLVMITLLAGLQTIPADYYEVAEIEGATALQAFRQVTVPSMLPSISSAVVVAAIWAFNAFTLPFIMTGGGPLRATEVLGLYIYKQAFTSFDFGAAAAAAIILFLLILLFVVAYLRIVRDEAT